MGFSKYAIVKWGWAEIAIEGCRPGRQRLNAVQLHSSPPGAFALRWEFMLFLRIVFGHANEWGWKQLKGKTIIHFNTYIRSAVRSYWAFTPPRHWRFYGGVVSGKYLGKAIAFPIPPWQHNPSHGKQIASEPFSFPCLCYKVTHKPSTRLKFSFVFLPQTVIRLWILFRFRLVNIVLAVYTALPYIYNIIYTTFIYFTARKIRYQRKVIFGKMTSANSFVVLIVCCVTKCWNDSDKAPAQGVQKVQPHQIRAIVKRINYMINSFVVAYQLLRLFCACVVMIGFQWD